MEMRCYSKILRISSKDHVTNKEIRAKIQQATGAHEDLTTVKRRKLQWYVMSPVHQVYNLLVRKELDQSPPVFLTKMFGSDALLSSSFKNSVFQAYF